MKREIDLIMFDLDGTLADSGRDLAQSVNYVRVCFELEPVENHLIYRQVGRGVEHLIHSFLPQTGQARFNDALELFLDHYENHLLDTTVLYPHVRETLEYFGTKKRAVISNKRHQLTLTLLRGLGIDGCFHVILGGDSVLQKKPHPAPLKRVLEDFSVNPQKALMVGDGCVDIQAGKKAGVHSCGVTYGLGDRDDLIAAEPDLLIDDLSELEEHFD